MSATHAGADHHSATDRNRPLRAISSRRSAPGRAPCSIASRRIRRNDGHLDGDVGRDDGQREPQRCPETPGSCLERRRRTDGFRQDYIVDGQFALTHPDLACSQICSLERVRPSPDSACSDRSQRLDRRGSFWIGYSPFRASSASAARAMFSASTSKNRRNSWRASLRPKPSAPSTT